MPTRLAAALLTLAALSGCAASTTTNPTFVSFQIDGMACPNCAAHIAEELRTVPGVRIAEVSFETKTAKVRLDPSRPASTESLNAAVAAWRKEHFAAEEDPECLDPKKREEIKRGG